MTVDFELAAYEAGSAARALDQFGITLNTDADRWLQRLDDLKANPPQPQPHNAVAVLVADAAKPAAIEAAIAAHVGHPHHVQQHALALNITGQRVLDAILADRDRIHAELAATAHEVIERLHRAAATDESISELTRQRRNDEAHLLACADSDAEQLRSMYFVRDEYLTPPQSDFSTGWWSCAQFANPWNIERPQPKDETPWGVWRASIRAGGTLWFPTIEDAHAASQAHEPGDMLPPIDPHRRTVTFTA